MSLDGSYELLETIISCPTEGVRSDRTLFLAQRLLIVKRTDSFGLRILITDDFASLVLVLVWLLLEMFSCSRSGHFQSGQGHTISVMISKKCLYSSKEF